MKCSLRRDERGTGVVGTAFGAAVFIAFLLLATHTLLSLYAGTIVTSTAWDTAHVVADVADSDRAIVAEQAKADARARLHGFRNADVEVSTTPDDVAVHITVDRPMFLPTAMARNSVLGRIDKTVHTRVEDWR